MSPRRVPAELDPENVRIGATLRMARESRGLRTGQAANALDISYAYLSNIEAGRKPLTPVMLARVAALYRVEQAAIVRPDLFEPASA